jgi:ankyrin repeat protein
MKTSLKILLTFVLFVSSITINAQDFFQSIRNGEYKQVEQFIQEEPELIDSIVKMDFTPIMFASIWGQDSIVELLLQNEADMYKVKNESGLLSLHFATMRNHPAVVGVLIAYGIDVNVKDGKNKTALVYAIETNNREIIDLLLKANTKFPEEQELMNLCLHSAVLYSLQDIADKLLEKGASLSSTDNNGRSLLHNAVIVENLKWVELLCEKNIDINKEDSFKRIPLHYSVESNQLEITKSLIKNGAEINSIDCTNRTPLDIAKGLVFVQIADFLEDNGGLLSEPKVFKIAGDTEEQQEVKVTYIANMGVLISSASCATFFL